MKKGGKDKSKGEGYRRCGSEGHSRFESVLKFNSGDLFTIGGCISYCRDRNCRGNLKLGNRDGVVECELYRF